MPRTPMLGRGYGAHFQTYPHGTPALRTALGASIIPQCLLADDVIDTEYILNANIRPQNIYTL